MIIYPAIDLLNRQCVRLRQGSFKDVTHYDRSPTEVAKSFEAAGATWIHVVDLAGSRDARHHERSTIEQIASSTNLRPQCGGGVRSVDDVGRLLDLGVRRVVVGSMAADRPDLLETAVAKFGAEAFTIAADVRLDSDSDTMSLPMVATQGWQEGNSLDVWTLVDRIQQLGIQDVLCTDIKSDGMLKGPNWQLYNDALQRFPNIRWQLSGGVSSLADVRKAKSFGLQGVIIGKAIYEGRVVLDQALAC